MIDFSDIQVIVEYFFNTPLVPSPVSEPLVWGCPQTSRGHTEKYVIQYYGMHNGCSRSKICPRFLWCSSLHKVESNSSPLGCVLGLRDWLPTNRMWGKLQCDFWGEVIKHIVLPPCSLWDGPFWGKELPYAGSIQVAYEEAHTGGNGGLYQ